MAKAGSVVVNLVANTGKFTKGLSRGTKSLTTFKKSTSDTKKELDRMGLVMSTKFVGAIAVAGAAVGRLIARNNELADSFVITGDIAIKYANSIGVAIDELQGLQYAAEQMGSSSESLNRSMIRMIANIGDAAKGVGEAKEAFEELGLDPSQLIAGTADESFKAIADSLKDVENATLAASLAYEIFGRRGVELINTLKLGSGGLSDFKDQAKDLGGIMSVDVAENIAEAKTEMDRLALIQRGFEQSKAGAQASMPRPVRAIKAWWQEKGPTRKFYDFTTGKQFSDEYNEEIRLADAAKLKAENIARVAEETKAAADAQKALNEATELAAQRAGIRVYEEMKWDLEDAAAGMDDLASAAMKMSFELGLTTEQYKELKGVMQDIRDFREAEKAEKAEEQRLDAIARAAENLKKSLRSPIEVFKDLRAEYQEMLDLGLISQELFEKAVRSAGESLMADASVDAFDAGRFEQVRTDLVDVAGLNSYANNPVLSSAKLNNDQNQKIIEELEKLNQKETLI